MRTDSIDEPDWRRFEHDVAKLFERFGYDVVENTSIRGGQTDLIARSGRRNVPDVIVEVKYSAVGRRVSIDEVENFTARVTTLRIDGEIDHGYLVTNAGFTADARAHLHNQKAAKFVFLVTFEELLATLLNSDAYLRSFVRSYEVHREGDRYVPLRCIDSSDIDATVFDANAGAFRHGDQNELLTWILTQDMVAELERRGMVERDPTKGTAGLNCNQVRARLDEWKAMLIRHVGDDDRLRVELQSQLDSDYERACREFARCVCDRLGAPRLPMLVAQLARLAPDIPEEVYKWAGLASAPRSIGHSWTTLMGRICKLRARRMRRYKTFMVNMLSRLEYPSPHIELALNDVRASCPDVTHVSIAPIVDVQDSIDAFLADESASLYVLLGDYGAGKSTALRHAMYRFACRKIRAPSDAHVRIPILISLKDYNKVADLSTLLHHFVREDASMGEVGRRLFAELNDDGYFVLFLDGFDEMLRRVTKADRRRCFNEIAQFAGPRSKVILSGRPGYFPDHAELSDVLHAIQRNAGAVHASRGRVLTNCLQLLNRREVELLLSRADPQRATPAMTLIENRPSLYDLARRPVLATMIVESAFDLLSSGQQQVSARDLYRIYTDRWVRREEDKGEFRVLGDADTKSTFVRYLAMQMHLDGRLAMPYKDLDQVIQIHFGLDEASLIDHFSHDIRTCSFLNRSDAGEYSFIHKSFMEYFVALEFERFEESPFAERFNRELIPEMVAFLDPRRMPAGFFPAVDRRRMDAMSNFIALCDTAKDEAVTEQDFELAAEMRDIAYIVRKMLESARKARARPVSMYRESYRKRAAVTAGLAGLVQRASSGLATALLPSSARLALDLAQIDQRVREFKDQGAPES